MEKLERLEQFLERTGLDSVWFARRNSFAWLTGGSALVDRESERGVGAIGYDGETVTLVANNIECDRLLEEELPDLHQQSLTTETFPWHEYALPEALAERVDGPAGADIDVPGFERIDPATVRQPLTNADIERYRALSRETATTVEAVCRELRPDDVESEVTAALTVSLSARDIEAPVVLVGGATRAQQYRHYTPKDVELGDYVLVSVTTERDGLHTSCTRTVAFDPPEWLEDHHTTAARVETTALASTQAAATDDGLAKDVFGDIQDAYAALGFDGEWEHHHQGGAAGFAGREWIGTPTSTAPVYAPMAYAWNPTVQGAKSEGTVLVTESALEPLTTTDEWPTITARAVGYDCELERPGILGVTDEDNA